MMDLRDARRKVDKVMALFNLARQRVQEEQDAAEANLRAREVLLESQSLTQQVAQSIQQEAHTQIASVVCRCLEAVFEEPYEFKILFEQKRGRTEARLILERDGVEMNPITDTGGGVVDVASFGLRLACLVLRQPPPRRLLVLDEPFKFVSRQYRPRVRRLLETLAKEMGVQILMVTHIDELQTGTVVDLRRDDDEGQKIPTEDSDLPTM